MNIMVYIFFDCCFNKDKYLYNAYAFLCLKMKDKKFIMFRIERITADKLKQLGHKGETYDKVINRLIKYYEDDA